LTRLILDASRKEGGLGDLRILESLRRDVERRGFFGGEHFNLFQEQSLK
jgi:hypothetical protein